MTVCWSRYRKTVVNNGNDAVDRMSESLSFDGTVEEEQDKSKGYKNLAERTQFVHETFSSPVAATPCVNRHLEPLKKRLLVPMGKYAAALHTK